MGRHDGEQILEKKGVMNISDIQGKDIWSGRKKKSMIFYSATNEGQMEWDLMQSHLIFLVQTKLIPLQQFERYKYLLN